MELSYIYCGAESKTADWDGLFKECFPIENMAYTAMVQAINANRNRIGNLDTMVVHHIIPKCFYEYKGLPIDNSPKNLLWVTQEEHLWMHCCCVACCNYNIKPMLKSPVRIMLGYGKDAQREGIRRAKLRGQKFGPEPIKKPPESIWRPIIDRVNRNEINVPKAMRLLGTKKSTFYRLYRDDLDHTRTTMAARSYKMSHPEWNPDSSDQSQ